MADDRLFAWTWPTRPTDETEFDQMMVSLDRHLGRMGLLPNQRGANAALVVSSVLGLSGTSLWGERDPNRPSFGASDLLGRVQDWYVTTYGDLNKINWSPGSAVVLLHDTLWELVLVRSYGKANVVANPDLTIPARGMQVQKTNTDPPVVINVLQQLKGLTPAYASRLTAGEMNKVTSRYTEASFALNALERVVDHQLFDEARGDYRHSVAALLAGNEFGKARWDAAQCAEKLIKGLLARDGHIDYPRRAGAGHAHHVLGTMLQQRIGLTLDRADLDAVHCSAAVRYGEEPRTREEALAAHNAVLNILSDIGRFYAPRGKMVCFTSEPYPPDSVD